VSGFVALFHVDGAPADERLLRRLMAVPPFERSSDGVQFVSGPVALGLTPLVEGLAPRASCHGFSQSDRACVVFDGCLYARHDLRDQLRRAGHPVGDGAADVDLVLAAYACLGERAVEHLLGDFTFCVWDVARQALVGARDHLGVKPFYYACVGQTIVLSNVLRSVRRHPDVSTRLDDEAICDLLLHDHVRDAARTPFRDVARLPAGHTLRCSRLEPRPHTTRYFALEPEREIRYRRTDEYVEHFRSLLSTAVAERLAQPVTAVLMSGGLDSSSIAALAAGAERNERGSGHTGSLRAYTAVYDRLMPDDEREHSSRVAAALRVPIEHVPVDDYALFDGWDGPSLPPEPTVEPLTAIMRDLLARAARHTTVVLSGDGGDPILGPSTVLSQLGRVTPWRLARALWQSPWRRSRPPLGLRPLARSWIRQADASHPVWLSAALSHHADGAVEAPACASATAHESLRAAALAGVRSTWWAATFESLDPGATGQPVEVRHPFFDTRLVRFALRLPSFPWCVDKTILRGAMRDCLPEAVRLRPKAPLAGDPVAVRPRWSMAEAERLFASAPGIREFVDVEAFTASVKPEHLLLGEAPGSLAAVCLAKWLSADATSRAAESHSTI
jgi:asparagine synthase (glutamine-hydrolysing)